MITYVGSNIGERNTPPVLEEVQTLEPLWKYLSQRKYLYNSAGSLTFILFLHSLGIIP